MITTTKKIADDFPILQQTNRDVPLVYLDSGASSQKPRQVIKAMSDFYNNDYANIHRGIYELSERSTRLYEEARVAAQEFINAPKKDNIVFVKGTTEAINLLASSLSVDYFKAGDEIIISEMEHHANIVPWMLLKERLGIIVKVIPVTDEGSLDIEAYQKLFSAKTKLVGVVHASNVLGTINPIKQVTKIAHAHGVPVLVDGAQAVPHMPVNVADLNCDFYVFSGHKMYGPTGIGVLYAKGDWLDKLPPYQSGGDMIETVSFEKVTFAKGPQKFEAGTPAIAEAVGMHAAINYLQTIGGVNIYQHEQILLRYAEKQLKSFSKLKIIGTTKPKVGVISFVHEDIHPHDLATILDHEGIAVRAGHHCAMPLIERFGVPATVRVSFGVYNSEQDVDKLVAALHKAEELFS